MKKNQFRGIICGIFLISLLICIFPTAADGAGYTLYINSASDPVSAALSSLYATGGKNDTGTIGSGSVYAMTSSGVVQIGTGTSSGPAGSGVDDDGSAYRDDPIKYTTVKVGLNYGSKALTEARLENQVGSGYRFGYFDEARNFIDLGYTAVTKLTMVADRTMTLSSGHTIGCYHIMLPGSYGNFDQAKQAADAVGGFPAYYNGTYYALYGNYHSENDAYAAMSSSGVNGSVHSGSSRCMVVTQTGTGNILFEFDYGSTYSLAVMPVSTSGDAVTWFAKYKYNGAFQYTRLSDDEKITVVNFVDIDDYVKGVVPYEMNGKWPLEALKAQALTARTYAASHFNGYRSYGFDVTNDTYSQVYQGLNSANSTTNAACDATAGQYIWYHGHLCETFFFSSDGGATESSKNVCGTELPYLQGVFDPYEDEVDTGHNNWTYTLTPTQVQNKINSKFKKNFGPITSITPEYTDMGNVLSLTFQDSYGNSHTVSRTNCYYALDVDSLRFTVTQDVSGNFVIQGSGWGHNCGMSQWGAYVMAKNHGMDASQIIKFYYTGAYVR